MAEVPALPGTHTWAKTLRALDRNVREVVGMVEDLPRSAEAALDLEMDYRTGDPVLDERAGRLRALRREQERAAAEIASDTSELLRRQDSPPLPRAEPARTDSHACAAAVAAILPANRSAASTPSPRRASRRTAGVFS